MSTTTNSAGSRKRKAAAITEQPISADDYCRKRLRFCQPKREKQPGSMWPVTKQVSNPTNRDVTKKFVKRIKSIVRSSAYIVNAVGKEPNNLPKIFDGLREANPTLTWYVHLERFPAGYLLPLEEMYREHFENDHPNPFASLQLKSTPLESEDKKQIIH